MSYDQKHPEVFSNPVVAQQALDTSLSAQGSKSSTKRPDFLRYSTMRKNLTSVLLLLLHLFLGYYFITKGLSDPRGPKFNHSIRP